MAAGFSLAWQTRKACFFATMRPSLSLVLSSVWRAPFLSTLDAARRRSSASATGAALGNGSEPRDLDQHRLYIFQNIVVALFEV